MANRIISGIFQSPFGYRYIRGLFHFGVRRAPIRNALELRDGDRVLDVGCGTGDYSVIVHSPRYSYQGIDMCEEYILRARADHGAPFRTFEVMNVVTMDFAPRSFDKALFLGVMHHLTDDENLEVLRRINSLVKNRLVIMDLSPGGRHFVNNILCRHDRGEYPRTLEEQCRLVNRVMKITYAGNYFVRSGIQRYSLMVASPLNQGVDSATTKSETPNGKETYRVSTASVAKV
ncbi:MAG: class I SAM-dependent methyltransferase [bacterium]